MLNLSSSGCDPFSDMARQSDLGPICARGRTWKVLTLLKSAGRRWVSSATNVSCVTEAAGKMEKDQSSQTSVGQRSDRSERTMRRTMKREPVVIINAVVTGIQASIPLLLAFGVAHMTQEEGAAISSAVVAWGGLLATFLGRNLVTPVAYPKDDEGRSLRADQLDQPRNDRPVQPPHRRRSANAHL
jgi:hypothetical protein